MGWIRSAPPPDRLHLRRGDGATLRRELPPGTLARLAASALVRSSLAANLAWSKGAPLREDALRELLPEIEGQPLQALLGRSRDGSCWLEVELTGTAALHEVASEWVPRLAGRDPPRSLIAGEADAAPAPAVPLQPRRAAPAGRESVPAEADGPFDLASLGGGALAVHAPVEAGDLEDLQTGERVYSARRGSCEVLRAGRSGAHLRDDSGRTLEVAAAELVREFVFDDSDPPPERE